MISAEREDAKQITRVLVSGGCGFVAHHFVEHILRNTDWEIVCVDKLSYSSVGYDRLRDISAFDSKRVTIVNHDFCLHVPPGIMRECGRIDYFVHMAAESHVDNSIERPMPFIESNVVGTHHALNMAKALNAEFLYFSTDEVYGPAPDGVFFDENSTLNPNNPYAATKASGEMLTRAYANTYQIPCVITNTMNVFGERQHPEKFIPLVIRKVLMGEKIEIHGYPDGVRAGSRVYLHARNAADAVLYILENSVFTYKDIPKYHICGEEEVDNLTLAQFIAKVVGKPLNYEIVDWHSSRPGHDLRYAMTDYNLHNIGFSYKKNMWESLEKTINWQIENERWLGI